jgi:hypothetical protein
MENVRENYSFPRVHKEIQYLLNIDHNRPVFPRCRQSKIIDFRDKLLSFTHSPRRNSNDQQKRFFSAVCSERISFAPIQLRDGIICILEWFWWTWHIYFQEILHDVQNHRSRIYSSSFLVPSDQKAINPAERGKINSSTIMISKIAAQSDMEESERYYR